MKHLIVLALVLFILAVPADASRAAPVAQAKTEITLDIRYSEAADLFSLMDNVTSWWEGFTDPVYREEWERRFGWSDADGAWARRYAEYRHRTFSDPSQGQDIATSPHGLFASGETNAQGSDPLAEHFMAQPDISTALSGLTRAVGKDDARMLRGFYAHFRPKWDKVLEESAPLAARAEELEAKIDMARLRPFIALVSRFYQTQTGGEFHIFFTRYPPGNSSMAEVTAGNTLLLRSPTEWTLEMGEWDMIVVHELVHYISSNQLAAHKRSLSDRFLARCPIPEGARRNWMIEEPLAVAIGQAAYSMMVLGKPLDRRSNWYAVPWVDLTARTMEASVTRALQSGAVLSDTTLVEEAADRCRDLTAMGAQLSR